MRDALRYEQVRVLTVRSTRICLALTAVGVLGLGYLAAQAGIDGDQVLWRNAFVQPLLLAAIIASVVAAQSLGQEYRFGLIRITLTAFPRRGRILAAKAIVVVVAALVFVAVSYAASGIAAAIQGPPPAGDPSQAIDGGLLLRGAVLMGLWCLSAWAIAGITRQTALGIIVPVVAGLIVEPILGAVLSGRADWLVAVLPWSAAGRWAETASLTIEDGTTIPAGWEGLGVFGLWVVLLVVIQAVLFTRRDA
jgi:ABC-2 type transport system permease protein